MRFWLFLALAAIGASWPLAAGAGSETLLLDDPAFAARTYSPVPFTHARHAARLDCRACHHDGSANTWSEGDETSCSACHDAAGRGRGSLRAAFHGLCLDCHRAQPASFAAPASCPACHPGGRR